MKYSLITLLVLFTLPVFAQNAGIIQYDHAVKLEFDMEGIDEKMKEMIPAAQVSQKTLLFNGSESIYKNGANKQDTSIEQNEDGNEMRIDIRMPDDITYVNINSKELVAKKELLGKSFLIVDELPEQEWKIKADQKKVLDHICMKAILADTTQDVVAWFAPALQPAIGPEGYHGLPGMILAIERDGGTHKIVATNINLDNPSDINIEKPTKGKQVTKKKYDAIREAKLEEMGMGKKGKGNVRVIVVEEGDDY